MANLQSSEQIQETLVANQLHKHVRKGFAFIISHEHFGSRYKKWRRLGNDLDVKNLKELLINRMKFDVRVLQNPTQDIIELELRSLFEPSLYLSDKFNKKKRPQEHHECVIVFVLTHGESGGILNDSQMKQYRIDDVWRPFVQNIKDKPLCFIFQACRGGIEDLGKTVNDMPVVSDVVGSALTSDEIAVSTGAAGSSDGQSSSTNKPRQPAVPQLQSKKVVDTSSCKIALPTDVSNVLIAFSTVDNHLSWRVTDEGTYYIKRLCEAMDEGLTLKEDLVSMLTRAQRYVAYETIYYRPICSWTQQERKQMPTFTSFLPYRLYFDVDQ